MPYNWKKKKNFKIITAEHESKCGARLAWGPVPKLYTHEAGPDNFIPQMRVSPSHQEGYKHCSFIYFPDVPVT